MTEEIANPETGAMTEADAIASLLNRAAPSEDKPAPAAKQDAEPASEPDDDEADDEAPEDEQPDTTPRYKVKAAGEDVEVTLDELLKGYSREADYRRKTQTLADERRQAAEEVQRQQQITAQLIEAYQAAAKGEDKEPDWAKLADELDPWEFNRRRAAHEVQTKAKFEAARRAQELQARQRRDIAAAEAEKLRERAPEWREPAKFKADYEAIVKVAVDDYGFAPDEVSGVMDHRLLLVLRDAAEMRRLRSAKPDVEKRVSKAPTVLKPSAPASKADNNDRDTLRNRLKRTGKVDDAVAFLMARGK